MRPRLLPLLPAIAIGLLAAHADAQVTPRAFRITRGDSPRAAIGISTSSSASARDTLGLLVTAITPKGPAEQAGIEEGNRIASINGTSLRLSAGDVGDWEMQGIMQRRLTRELEKVKPGDEVELRVYAGGQFKTVRVKTIDSDDLYRDRSRVLRARLDDRPTIGLGIGSTGSRRDTLGVFVMFADDSGPAARAGIVEGDRIASINGVDVRVSRTDAGDPEVGGAKARRLERELASLQPGDDADLRVWSNGQYRNVKVKVARSSDLPRRRSSFMYMGGGFGMMPPMPAMTPMPPMPPMPPMSDLDIEISPEAVTVPMRRALEQAVESARRAMEGVNRALVLPRGFEWNDDDAVLAPEAPAGPEMRMRTRPTPAPAARRAATSRSAAAGIPGGVYAPAIAAVGFDGPVTAMPAVAWSGPEDDGATIVIDGLRLAPVNPELARYLGNGSDRGALVLAAPSWASGLHAGDVITAVDGKPLREGDGLSISIDRSQSTTITYLRDGKRHDTKIAGSY